MKEFIIMVGYDTVSLCLCVSVSLGVEGQYWTFDSVGVKETSAKATILQFR